ncbi:MAG: hypothetical protein JNN17_25585 [Verrucomicrobiaceae bacterium]|nr:hypothetical protein [Verrucomicrobiaceae bacterium]
MINATVMSLIRRIALVVLASASLTSCQTLGGLMNTLPFRLLDEAGAEAMSLFSENNLPATGRPESIEQRARRIEMNGEYVGRMPMGTTARGSSMAAR